MNFNVESKTSTFDQNVAFNELHNARADQMARGSVDAANSGNMGGLSVIGIKVSEIANMKEAIRNMCNAISEKINELETDVDSNTAFKAPGLDTVMKQYLENVVAYCNNLTSSLNAFNDKLSDVQDQWDALTTDTTEKVGSNAGQFATGSKYTEQRQ